MVPDAAFIPPPAPLLEALLAAPPAPLVLELAVLPLPDCDEDDCAEAPPAPLAEEDDVLSPPLEQAAIRAKNASRGARV